MPKAQLTFNDFDFNELVTTEGLVRIDQAFLEKLRLEHPAYYQDLLAYRTRSVKFNSLKISELLIVLAPILEEFIAHFFNIEKEVERLRLAALSHSPIFVFKECYLLRRVKRRLNKDESLPSFVELDAWLASKIGLAKDKELAVASLGQSYLTNQQVYAEEIEKLTQWCIQAIKTEEGKNAVKGWVSFKLPHKLDYQHLVPMKGLDDDQLERLEGKSVTLRQRDGFGLTDPRMTDREILNEAHYCVYCHKNQGDYCSKGFLLKKNNINQGLKINPLGETLTGCPLEEKISEMHFLKKEGFNIAALAVVMVDNPMCPATGHRICNDCMKACIYQKQDPVNIPQIETGVLSDVLSLPWGVEIYDLLTRWNPLRCEQYITKPYNGLKVLIVGTGPAGFTLAHHLLQEGFAVVACDGLKIEPLPTQYLQAPIHCYEEIKEALDKRVMTGFGGVAEYGITARWDKNFLKLIYISISRRTKFQVFGGVRFGGTLTVEDAWELGFDHLVLAVGAGLPKELAIPNSLAPGMRQANDFLMALQLTGAAKQSSLANLQVRLPAVVIGSGLTGIDTATEAQAYYIAQVEKILMRYEKLAETLGEARIRQQFDEANLAIIEEFVEHGRLVREERNNAKTEGRKPDFIRLIRSWGGVTILNRRKLQESPAYKRNHEEALKALEEGIYYAEGLESKAVKLDQFGHVEGLVCQTRINDQHAQWIETDEEKIIPARSIFVATGARPNVAYEFEHRNTFKKHGFLYMTFEEEKSNLESITPPKHCKAEKFGPFTSYDQHNKRVTFIGDVHPVFHGSVVKAIASAKRTYPKIVKLFGKRVHNKGKEKEYQLFAKKMSDLFTAKVVSVERKTPSVIELTVKAPIATRNFLPGQFYRVQNFETLAPMINGTKMQTESLALIGAEVNRTSGQIKMMVIEKGVSSRLVAEFKTGDPISIMGPTGVRTRIDKGNQTVMIIGGRLSVAHIRSVGKAMRAEGNNVLFVGGFQVADEVYCQKELEACADVIVWITHSGQRIQPTRLQDCSVTTDIIEGIVRYAKGELSQSPDGPDIPLEKVDRVLVIGPTSLIKKINHARFHNFKSYLVKQPQFTASIYGPMQCMLKGVCAQCLNWQVDPYTGKRTKAVFTCSWQDQPLNIVDLNNLDERLSQNHAQEILNNLWLDYLKRYN